MLAPWAKDEMEQAALKDKRLNTRLVQVLSDLGERPQASIPAACGGHAETMAAYRFFDNEESTPEAILESHFKKTCQRIGVHATVVLVQDTTELDFTRPTQQVVGAGPLSSSSQRGACLHPLVAFTTDGTPLGAAWSRMWTRDDEPVAPSRTERKQHWRTSPIEQKESFRWLEGLRAARDVAQDVPQTTCVCVADSEADIYELLAEPRGSHPLHLIVRAAQNRRIISPEEGEMTDQLMHSTALAAPVLFTKKISVRGRQQKIKCKTGSREQPRQSRKAEVEVRATTVTLHPPQRSHVKLAPVTINVVLVREVDAPPDDVPVEWLLLTTLPIATAEQVQQVVHYYTLRFMIEVYFRVLKSGCRVEERLFEQLDRLLNCVAVYLIVAWRTLMICRLGQGSPELDCEAVFEPAEWKSVWMVVQREPPPSSPPNLGTMIRLVAQLGGYVNRPGRKDPPGPQTVWLGLQRARDLAWAWQTFGPGATDNRKRKRKLV